MTQRYTNKELLTDLWEYAEELGEIPSSRQADGPEFKHSVTTYQRRFGSWAEAKEMAGLPEPGAWSDPDEPYKNEEKLRELYLEQDLTQSEIADRFGISSSAVSNWIRRFEITKQPDHPWRDPEALREFYWQRGCSLHDLADKWGTNPETVLRWMRRYDIDRRNQSRQEKAYYDKDVLTELYWGEGLSQSEIAEQFGISQGTISSAMLELEIPTQEFRQAGWEKRRVNRTFFYTDKSGYENASARVGDKTKDVRVHRLVAVAEHGVEAVSGQLVHHKNEIPWDNRPANLELMGDSEHKRHHATTRGEQPPEGFDL